MFRTVALTALLAFAPASAALAHNCPNLMMEIDAALTSAELSENDMQRVEELRAQGEELHNAGDHDGSMAALEEAKQLLGI